MNRFDAIVIGTGQALDAHPVSSGPVG